MTKAAGGLAFALKAAQPFGVAAHLRRQYLNRDPIAQQNVARAKNGAHAAFAQQSFDLILAVEDLADERAGILFQDFAVLWTEADAVVEFFVADGTEFHGELVYNDEGIRRMGLIRRQLSYW